MVGSNLAQKHVVSMQGTNVFPEIAPQHPPIGNDFRKDNLEDYQKINSLSILECIADDC